jgi:hypothetical protein
MYLTFSFVRSVLDRSLGLTPISGGEACKGWVAGVEASSGSVSGTRRADARYEMEMETRLG